MPKREYIGDPINAVMTSIKERKEKGQTVAGTTEDDLGEERTEAWPDFMDREQFTERQREIIQNRLLHSDGSLRNFAERFDYSYPRTSQLLKEVREEYEAQLKERGIYERLVPPSKRGAESLEERVNDEEQRERVRLAWRENPNAKAAEIKEVAAANDLSINQVSALKQNAVESEPYYETEQETGIGAENEQEIETEDRWVPSNDTTVELRRLRREVTELRRLLTAAEGRASDDPAVGELDADTLFAIVAGEDLSPEQRRQVFGLVVD